VTPQEAAILKTTLVGVELPAGRKDLLSYALREGAEPMFVGRLGALPDREYESLDEVVEAILHVQPRRIDADALEPHEESGAPPGGDAYVRSS
jgi:Protein of unknown function (DUF2795)